MTKDEKQDLKEKKEFQRREGHREQDVGRTTDQATTPRIDLFLEEIPTDAAINNTPTEAKMTPIIRSEDT